MKKRLLTLFLLIPVCAQLLNLFVFHYDGSVRPRSFAHGFKDVYETKVEGLDPKILDTALSQSYHYLGHGKQMLALESADGKYVVKLFNPMRPLKKRWYLQAKFWRRYTSLKWISREWGQKDARLLKLFKRHKIAFENLRDETGLLYVHSAPSPQVNHFLHVTDERGRRHIFSLAETPFVIQKKAILVPNHINSLLREGKTEEAKSALQSLEDLFAKRADLGITDRIQTMNNNYGFVGKQPIQIDVGRIQIDESLAKKEDLKRILANFQDWVEINYPSLR